MNRRRRSNRRPMGRPPLNVRGYSFKIGRDLPARIDAVLRPKETRASLMREAIEAEVRRRERKRKKPPKKNARSHSD